MSSKPKPFPVDFTQLENEVLVVLAKECGCVEARNALYERLREDVENLISICAGGAHLQEADKEEAGQEAFFAVLVAIRDYDTLQLARPDGRGFRSFVYQVITARFLNFVRGLRRQESHFDQIGNVELLAVKSDAERQAARQELLERLREAVAALDEEARSLWALLLTGIKLTELADHLGVSYDSARRRRNMVLIALTLRLKCSRGLSPEFSPSQRECLAADYPATPRS